MRRFAPNFTITPKIARALMRIEASKEAVVHLPITAGVLASLRETARLFSTHYSTAIEGNRLTQEQVVEVIEGREHFAGRERDEREVLGYYAAMEKVEEYAAAGAAVSVKQIQMLHGLVMAGGRRRVKGTTFRDGQNVIRDGRSGRIVYLPPEAKDVPQLMVELVNWINGSGDEGLPCPIRAGIAHYEFATVHPYYDGNGRTARLLTTLVLHLGGYDLKGLYSLEEYYARELGAYYEALTVGASHNYYEGRAEGDITKWVDYFCAGMAESFENVKRRAEEAARAGAGDESGLLRRLDPRQRKALALFRGSELIGSADLAKLFGISQRTARNLLSDWVRGGFVGVANASRKGRRYRVGKRYRGLLG